MLGFVAPARAVTVAANNEAIVTYTLQDEYRLIQTSAPQPVTLGAGGAYSFTVMLQASRRGSDKNGRTYTFIVTATDGVNLTTSVAQRIVAVEHNQSK